MIGVALIPVDVAPVMAWDHHLPVRLRTPQPAGSVLASLFDADNGLLPSLHVSAGIDRIGHDVGEAIVDRQLPDHSPAHFPVDHRWRLDALLP